jgi:gluconolactonase
MTWTFELVHGPLGRPIGGLAWDGSGMLFSDVNESTILRYDPSSAQTSEFRKYTNRTSGIAFGAGGVLYGCQEGSRRVIAFLPDGSATPTATRIDSHNHNYPTHLTVDRRSRVWFSDPYSTHPAMGPIAYPLLAHQSVLRLTCSPAPQSHWRIERATFDTSSPRGIALSPDEATLFVADTENVPGGRRELRAYPLDGDHIALDTYRVLHTFGADPRGVHRGIEGLCIDTAGNVIACAGWDRSGPGALIYVFSPTGAVLASHTVPVDMPAVCAFGDTGLTSLYVGTTGGHLFRIRQSGYQGHLPYLKP